MNCIKYMQEGLSRQNEVKKIILVSCIKLCVYREKNAPGRKMRQLRAPTLRCRATQVNKGLPGAASYEMWSYT